MRSVKRGKFRQIWEKKMKQTMVWNLFYGLNASFENPWNRIRNPMLYPIELQAHLW